VRVVLDPNVLISALISPAGPAAEIVRAWTEERFDLIVSPALIAAEIADPPRLAGVAPDPDDDYLVALARAASAHCLVSGDRHLTELVDPSPPVLTPRDFLSRLRGEEPD
jgi:uncharacterized protein